VHLHLLRSEPIQGFLSRFVSADPSSTHRYIEQGELVLADDSNKLLDKPRPRDYVNAGSSTAIRRQEESLEAEAIQRCQVMLRNLYLLSRTSGNLHAFDVAGRIALGDIGQSDKFEHAVEQAEVRHKDRDQDREHCPPRRCSRAAAARCDRGSGDAVYLYRPPAGPVYPGISSSCWTPTANFQCRGPHRPGTVAPIGTCSTSNTGRRKNRKSRSLVPRPQAGSSS
jgi:hypothetical protein